MTAITQFEYTKNVIPQIREWTYGTNWPIVYICYNNTSAYVGETLDAVRRTEQHLQENEFDLFTHICLISDKTFNKSVILDLESFLIKYMSADGSRALTNGNAGVADHNYFYKEAYLDDFKEIWNQLLKLGIVQKSISDIENSELFKYSPYKTLNTEQQKASYEILKRIYEINNASTQSIIQVTGGAGTGKTILAVYLVKLLVDIRENRRVWDSIEDYQDAVFIQKLAKRISGIKNIGFVVPMVQLRTTMKDIFKTVDGLSEDMVLAPEEVVQSYYDVLIVDEAHRLYQRKHLPGLQLYKKFDIINEQLMSSIQRDESDLTELDWIIRSSRIQILFYDKLQAIRTADISRERFEAICKPHLYKYVELFSQMRCKGGNGYYEYVKKVLSGKNLGIRDYTKINNYHLEVVDNIHSLFDKINEANTSIGLCNVVSGPGWSIEEDIVIDGETYNWYGSKKAKDPERSIYSIHKIQGFDLNYTGVIFGKEIAFDSEKRCVVINKNELRDNFTKSNGDEAMLQYIVNIYLTLMTRGIRGTYVYAVDKNLQNYLKDYFS